ncbi:MAG: beta-ketoacyl-[acyl-carrier-protein] synthase II [Armatimonadetes bacterium 55-13]|nr:beta-ketoacyl-ACP synthase II [Armatimonadota bacterium]OJU64228.1 MAG: beta-ketoacyl-[acyl-carrier-protein] synthase II [Armatimonadetes bacterium 55-13]
MSDRPVPSGRVVITGVGAVTPLGTGVAKFWPRLLAGESAVERITLLDPSEYTTQIAAEVKDFVAEDWLDKKEARRIDRFIAFAVAAAAMAMQDSEIKVDDDLRNEFGVMIGSGIGGLTYLGEQHRRQIEGGPSKVSPFLVPYMIPDMASGYVSILNGLKGPNTCVVTACSTGANAIGDAYHIIKRGDAICMLAGGTEAPINELGLGGFCAARAMTTRNDDPAHASRPFDKDRDGFVIGEGSAVFVLEDYDHAIARGAKIYGEVIGYGMTGDAYHITQPDPNADGAYRAVKMALRTAGKSPEDIGYVNAHGTSTYYNDKGETMAIKRAFGDHAYNVPVSSTKSMIGHTLGAAGAIEALICLLAMRDSKLPPTINYETPDPECDLDYIPNVARDKEVNISMSNSYGFGGHNVSLILKKV